MKKLLALLIVFAFYLTLAWPVSAANFQVECGDGCSKSGLDLLFPESEIWYPGRVLTRTFSIKNISGETKSVSMQASRQTSDNSLEKVMLVEIVHSGERVWGKDTLEKFYDAGRIDLENFAHNELRDYDFTVEMTDVGNEYQNKKSQFDFTLGFWEEPASVTPTPTPGGFVQGAQTIKVEWYDGQGGPLPEESLGGGIATEAGAVEGAKTKVCPFWWVSLLGQTLILAGLYFWLRKGKVAPRHWWLTAATIVILGFLVDRYAHTHWFVPSKICRFEPILGLSLAFLETKALKLLYKKKFSFRLTS